MIDIMTASQDDLRSLDNKLPEGVFNSVVIVPTGELHDSGYMCMKFILCDRQKNIVGVLGGCSDVIHLDGIGGYGQYDKDYSERVKSRQTHIIAWCIDCIPCGFVRLFCDHNLIIESPLSDCILYVKKEG